MKVSFGGFEQAMYISIIHASIFVVDAVRMVVCYDEIFHCMLI